MEKNVTVFANSLEKMMRVGHYDDMHHHHPHQHPHQPGQDHHHPIPDATNQADSPAGK